MLWVLCLDEASADAVRQLAEPDLRALPLTDLEKSDPALVAARANRSWVEYVFTLSPCWPRFLLQRHTDISVLTYVDADMAFFSSPKPIFDSLGEANVLVVEHRFPSFLHDLKERGHFNVGVLCFRNNEGGRAVLDDWRSRCLEWCHDRVEATRFADQKYLDAWPRQFSGVVICPHPGVNLAPWNWMAHRYQFRGESLLVDGQPLVVFHFARFRRLGPASADSGQLEYGVMPFRLRSWIYGRYWVLLERAAERLTGVMPSTSHPMSVSRGKRAAWKSRLLELTFGSIWYRCGPWWISGGFGPGRFSGRALRWVRRSFARRRAAVP